MARYFSRHWFIRSVIAMLACALMLLVEWQRPELLVRLDEGLRDAFLRLTANQRPEMRLVVIDIDEASIEEVGPWPWPRERLADLTEILLGTYRVQAVGLDIVFPEPGEVQGDARMAALAAYAPLILAQIFDYTPRNQTIEQGTLAGGLEGTPNTSSGLHAYGYIANHTELAANARCVGNIGYKPDSDGVLRHLPASTHHNNRVYPTLSSMLLTCSNSKASNSFGSPQGLWRVPYSRALSAYTVIAASDILNGRAPHDLIKGRYALVGSSSLGLGDRVSTPLAPLNAGIMVHAASLSGLLDLAEGRTNEPWSGRIGLVMWSVLSIALAVFYINKLSAWGSLFLLMCLILSWLALAFAGVARQAEWSITAPLWAYFFLLITAIPFEWWKAQQKSRRLLTSFSHYVAQPVLDEIVRLDLQHSLEPTLRNVTVLIADMEGYTSATASLALEDAATLTKEFLGCLTRPVLAGRGTLDKYTGDGLVSFWGAPLTCPDQADRAVNAALEILAEVDALNMRRQLEGFLPVRARIGIESGRALVGDLGTTFRSTYTAVGDCINFASRLEEAARELPTQLVIGTMANSQLTQHKTISLGQIALRGTQKSIEAFTVKR